MSGHYPPSRQVSTSCGPIVGLRMIHEGARPVDAFLGIPYAQPPVGSLRFKKPQAHEGWTEVRQCIQLGYRSIQQEIMPKKGAPTLSEDCLTLNVFSPAWESEDKFPVLVFIHGGAFLYSSAAGFSGVNLCEHICKKDTIIVTIQYRLSYLGLWSTGDGGGNQMLWDQTFALRWVQDNIAQFNGDPGNVTLWGQSAGGICADLLSVSPHSRDLFHKLVIMANTATGHWVFQSGHKEICRKFAEKYGIDCSQEEEEILEELQKIPAEEFIYLLPAGGLGELSLTLDEDFFPKHPKELRKESPTKLVILGQTRDEGLLWWTQIMKSEDLRLVRQMTDQIFHEEQFPLDYAELREEYLKKVSSGLVEGDRESLYRTIATTFQDRFVTFPQQLTIDELIDNGWPTYLYRFDHYNRKAYDKVPPVPFRGPSHCTDLSYAMGVAIGLPFDFDEDDKKMTQLMSTLVCNFTRCGDPNGEEGALEGGVSWRPLSREEPQLNLQIDLESSMKDEYFEGRALWYLQKLNEAAGGRQ